MFIQLKNKPGFQIVEGYSAKAVHTNQLSVMHVSVKAGAPLPEHHHPHEQITNIIEGKLEMTVGGVTKVCEPGDVVVILSNVPHSAVAITDCQVIDVFNPPREDLKYK